MSERARRIAALAAIPRPGASLPRPAQAETRFQALGDRTAEVFLYGVVGWDIWVEDLVPELAALDVDELICHVNSPGGDAFDGIALANTLAAHKANVVMHIEGMAASAASIIAMAGDEIVMHPGARLMVHDALCMSVGNAADHRAAADLCDAVSQDIAGIYASRTGGSADEWRQKMLAETWLSADESVACGLADRVVTRDQPAEDDAPALAPAARGFTELVAQWRDATPDAARPDASPAATAAEGRASTPAVGQIEPIPALASEIHSLVLPDGSGRVEFDPPLSREAAEAFRTTWNAAQSSAPEAEAPPAPEPQSAAVNLADLVAGAIREGVTL